MGRKTENTGFTCEYCGRDVLPVTNGSFRNHCPFCLRSKHVDVTPGDRAESCGGRMEPRGLEYKPGKGWQLIFTCASCGKTMKNMVADDTAQPDDLAPLLEQMKTRGFKPDPRRTK